MDNRRDQIIEIIKREFIGPDPINEPGMIQDNGEEILTSDPPRIRYLAGILFPQKATEPCESTDNEPVIIEQEERIDNKDQDDEKAAGTSEFLQDAEELLNLSNSYHQSAMSVTASVKPNDRVFVLVSAAKYVTKKEREPDSEKERVKYLRVPIKWSNDDASLILPKREDGVKKIDCLVEGQETHLCFAITYRYSHNNSDLYTFTLENLYMSDSGKVRDEECFFQVEFSLKSELGFSALPDSQKININDNDYLSNQLLYRNVKGYALGHGCAAEWNESDGVIDVISTSVFPEYEVKPVVPAVIDGVSLDMFELSDYGDEKNVIIELTKLSDEYEKWINKINSSISGISDKGTASRHISNCKECLSRMRDGITLLKNNSAVMLAFRLMNRAMLLQQLHYNIPLQTWSLTKDDKVFLERKVERLPDIKDRTTWYGDRVYGKWRPFQLAFVLINLRSMYERDSDDRSIVDLIWFPTGGGKTEAYLGLSAYTIFIRRILDKDNSGTTILMRYTLRLLTSQQYERASSMICACETIRREMESRLGQDRITIGLWVGGETSPNSMSDAVSDYDKLYNSKSDVNPFVVLKCPWCGAQMGVVNKKGKLRETPGYKKIKVGAKKKIVFQCSNSEGGCAFSSPDNCLPLYVVDDDIYANRPTLLLGTVDKFAMLPYRPEAQSIFGFSDGRRITAPDLIIQDELHLISGPLGSMVGHYETMIDELCMYTDKGKEIHPKIIASTATISRADEQCNALYACSRHKVKQFPPAGIDADDSFFAVTNKEKLGRRYVGILANAASSIATTSIRLYAALLYAAKAIKVDDESLRDGYWTNVGYFNSIRELGQTETWIKADIDEYLHVIYKRRYEDRDENYRDNRRYIWRDEELTSRIRSDKIPAALQNMCIKYPTNDKERHPVDICLATNMISVGVDVPRLGLMTVLGQPKTTSEYIQATSRVGRSDDAPGLVFVVYNPSKPRDKSHYENFVRYHSRMYCNVEPTSVTPFSAPLRERALHALVIGILRLERDKAFNEDPPRLPNEDAINRVKDIIASRIKNTDPDELQDAMKHIDYIIDRWRIWEPQKYQDFTGGDALPLMFPLGTLPNELWGERGLPTPTSMRSVDGTCEAYVIENGYYSEDE